MSEEAILDEGGDHFLRGVGIIPVVKQGPDKLLKPDPWDGGVFLGEDVAEGLCAE